MAHKTISKKIVKLLNMKDQPFEINVTKKGIYKLDKSNFSEDVMGDGYKIYIIKDKNNIIYVGMTKQSIGTRFRGSFYAYNNQKENKKLNGYSGYKWIEDYMENKKKLDLYIFSLPEYNNEPENIKEFIEAIEAEIVYKIRSSKKGQWPIYQHEIHFHNISEAKLIAKNIYSQVK